MMDSRKTSTSDAASTTLVPCSTGSSSSSIPTTAIEVHDHILPTGWTCKADPSTKKYYFQRDWDICHSSTSSSPTQACGYTGSFVQSFTSRYKVSEFAVQRITKIFPDVDEGHISYLLRIYHNREEIVIKSLLGEGCRVDGIAAVDEELFYKLRKNFPFVNPDQIRMLLAKHNNIEHETIAAILYSQSSKGFRFDSTRKPGSPRIKLRYLKLLFPTVDEDKLFDLLYNNEHNAQFVIDSLERMGYKKEPRVDLRTLGDGKKCGTGDHPPATAVKNIRPTSVPLQFPVTAAERAKITKRVKVAFPNVDDVLVDFAIECSAYDEERAILFLSSMTPQDSDKYLPQHSASHWMPDATAPSVSTQTGAFISVLFGSPVKLCRRNSPIETNDVATWTKEDGIILPPTKPVTAIKADPRNKLGNTVEPTGPSKVHGSDRSLREGGSGSTRGSDASLRNGPKRDQLQGSFSDNRKGKNLALRLPKPVKQIDW